MNCHSTQKDFSIHKRTVRTPKGIVTVITLTNRNGATAELSSLGAGITRIIVPDKNGVNTDVVMGYANDADYLFDSPCAGKTPGRFANRIGGAKFTIDGKTYRLVKNDGENSLHGGPEGFQNQIWDFQIVDEGVKFTYLSPEGEMGYPGNLKVSVTYRWKDDNTLDILYEGETDAPTIINLTNHVYFTLHGCGKGDILDHLLTINGSKMLQSDIQDIPTGKILSVENTPFDFLHPKELGRDINVDFENLLSGKGYNHYFLIDNIDGTIGMEGDSIIPRHAATLYCHKTGIKVDISTTMPGLMLYTGNWLAQSPTGRNGEEYHDHDGVAIECQFPPDAPNHPEFHQVTLRPGEKYRHSIRYSFSS